MSLIDSLAKTLFKRQLTTAYESGRKAQTQYPAWALSGASIDAYTIDAADPAKQAALYQKLTWLSTAIDITAQTAASGAVPMVKRMNGEGGKDIINHAFEQLLRNPNPLQSQVEFFNTLFSWFKLSGNAYIFLNRASANVAPSELWVMPSDKVKPIPDGKLYLRGYTYNDGAREHALEIWQVIHVKTFNPTSAYTGLSQVESLITVSSGDLARQAWSTNLYSKDNAKIPGALAFADYISDDEWDKLKADTKKNWGGGKQSGPLFLRNVGAGGVQWVAMSMSQKDMELLNERQQTKEEIWSKIAPGLSSILDPNATEANATAGKAVFLEFVIFPLLQLFAQKFTQKIMPSYGSDLVFEFEDVRESNRLIDLQEQDKFIQVHTVSEIRKEYYGREPLGDERDNLFIAQITTPAAPSASATTQTGAVSAPSVSTATAPQVTKSFKMQDLERWERKAINALKSGKSAAVVFESEYIDVDTMARISDGLLGATNNEQVKSVFDFTDNQTAPQRDSELTLLLAEVQAARADLARASISVV